MSDPGLNFRALEGSDGLAGGFPQGHGSAAQQGQTFIEHAGGMDAMVKEARAPKRRRQARDDIHPASTARAGVLAVDIVARAQEQRGIRVKGEIDDAVSLVPGEGDEIGEQNQPVRHPAGPEGDEKQLHRTSL